MDKKNFNGQEKILDEKNDENYWGESSTTEIDSLNF